MTKAYMDAQCKGSYKKNQNRKAITGVKWKKNQNQMQTRTSVKSKNGQQEGTVCMMHSGGQEEISHVLQFPCSSTFLAFSALLSFWYLICNAEFDSNSSCLDRLNNFGTISSQKL